MYYHLNVLSIEYVVSKYTVSRVHCESNELFSILLITVLENWNKKQCMQKNIPYYLLYLHTINCQSFTEVFTVQ